jgi:hypothetical protein
VRSLSPLGSANGATPASIDPKPRHAVLARRLAEAEVRLTRASTTKTARAHDHGVREHQGPPTKRKITQATQHDTAKKTLSLAYRTIDNFRALLRRAANGRFFGRLFVCIKSGQILLFF